MTDLPYAQPIFNDDPKNDSNVGESFSEKPPVEPSFSPEKAPAPETLPSPENIPIPKPESQKETKETPITAEGNNQEKIKNVVDKTSEITTLHDVAPTKDKLTIEADEEEERFIEEVEKHHGKL